MHPNPAYRQSPREANVAFARARGFGTLAINATDGPLASHVPFVLGADGACAEFHLVRSNPIARALSARVPALLSVMGPDAYISPDWYGVDHQVPTWNYVAVHLRGRLSVLPDAALRDHLDSLSDAFEARLLPKTPWRTEKMPDDLLERMMRAILPCRLDIETIDGTWKLTQNKPADARLAAAQMLSPEGPGQEIAALAALMRAAGA